MTATILWCVGIHLMMGVFAYVAIVVNEVRRRREFRRRCRIDASPVVRRVMRDLLFVIPCGVVAVAALPVILGRSDD